MITGRVCFRNGQKKGSFGLGKKKSKGEAVSRHSQAMAIRRSTDIRKKRVASEKGV